MGRLQQAVKRSILPSDESLRAWLGARMCVGPTRSNLFNLSALNSSVGQEMERDQVDSTTTYSNSDFASSSSRSSFSLSLGHTIPATSGSSGGASSSSSSVENSRNLGREDPAACFAARKRSSNSGTYDKRLATKICRVCGDRAYSYNFNVITCESCKAFFRRNANKEKEIRCPFNNRCEINIVSRRFCQRCRLQKCFNVGMKKEWIMSEEARLEKKQRVQENRERRLAEATGAASCPKKTSKSTMDNKSTADATASEVTQAAAAATGAPSQPNVATLLPNLPVLPAETVPLGLPNQAAAAAAAAAVAVGDMIVQNAAAAAAAATAPFPAAAATLPPAPAFRSSLPGPISGLPVAAAAAAAGAFLADQEQTMVNQMAQQVQMAQVQLQQTAVQMPQHLQQHVATQQIVQQQAVQLAAAQAQQQQLVAAATAVAAAENLAPQKPAAVLNVASQLESLNEQFNQLGQNAIGATMDNDEVVTIPKDVFVHLVNHKQSLNAASAPAVPEYTQKCVCTCHCGKYQAGKLIVDEILAELGDSVSGGNANRDQLTMSSSDLCTASSIMSPSSNRQPEMTDDTSNTAKEEVIDVDSTSTPEHNALFSLDEEREFVKKDQDLCPWTVEDQNRLDEVLAANRIWAELDGIDAARHQHGCPSKLEMINMADGAIRRMIKMVKSIEQFRKIEQHDQIQLLKNSCMEYIILRGAMSYDPVQNTWIGPTPSSGFTIRMDGMKDTPTNLFENSIRFYASFKEEWRTNESVMLLLGMIVIFNPEFPNLHNRDAVKEQHQQYKRVLKRLLFSLCNQNPKRAIVEMKGLLDRIENLKQMDARAQRMLSEVDANSMEPLLVEIFGH